MPKIDKIGKIHQAEAEAAQIRADALEKSRLDMRHAEEEVAQWKEEQLRSARKQSRKSLEAAQIAARDKAEQVRAQEESKNSAIQQEIEKQMDNAVQYIVDQIREDIA